MTSAVASRIDPARLLILLAGVLLFLSFGFTEMAGSDLWWHLAAGRELVQTGSLWMVDDWSFTAHGRDWLNHEWLADLVYYGWALAFGVPSLVYWKWLVIMATFTVLLTTLARSSGSALAALLAAAVAVAIAAPFLDIRPQLYSLLGYSLLLSLCLERDPRAVPLALLFVLWVNLHGGFFFGLMALGILLLPWREPRRERLWRALRLGAVCLLACLLNPSGVKLFLYPLAYALEGDSPFRTIGEWLPPSVPGGIRSPLFFVFMWLPLLAPVYLLPRVRRAAGIPWEGLLLTALTLAMALTSRRFIPLYAMSLAVLFTPLLALGLRALRLETLRLACAAAVLVYALVRLSPYPLQAGPAFHYLAAEYGFPVEMMNFVEANGIGGRVFALWNWGGYIDWRTDGRLRVFVDGRADTIFDDETYLQYVAVLGSRPGWLALVEHSGADYVLWPHARGGGREKLRELVATGRWQPVYSDAVAWLLARRSAVPERGYEPSPPGPWRDLALAVNSQRAGRWAEALRYAAMVREVMPWQRDACNVMIAAYRSRHEPARADAVRADCLAYFPSAYLR